MTEAEFYEEKIANLQSEISDLETQLEIADKAEILLQGEIEKLEKDNDELQGEINDLENALGIDPFVEVFERLADTRNWIDGRYAPIIKELYDNVPDLCSAVLRENQ